MSQIRATTTMPPITVVHARSVTTTLTVVIVYVSLGLPGAPGQHSEVSQLIEMYATRVVASFFALLWE